MDTKVHTRYRNKAGIMVPGVTTVLGLLAKPALIHWAWKLGLEGEDYRKVRDSAGNIGTLTHYMVECFLRGMESDLRDYTQSNIDLAIPLVMEYKKWWEQSGLEVEAVEEAVVSELWQFGGCIDLVAKASLLPAPPKFIIMDLKTSKGIYDEYKMQLAAYKFAWNELHPDRLIEDIKVVHLSKETGKLAMYNFGNDLDHYFDIFKHLRAIYVLQKKTDPKRRVDPKLKYVGKLRRT